MATEARQHHAAEANGAGELRDWQRATRVFLQPIAAPSILGLFGFAGATFIVGARLAGWYGTPASGEFLFPFAITFGGIAQFAAAMWAYRARDGLATAMHVLNAIPHVVEAEPGVLTFLDLPVYSARHLMRT